MQKKLEPLFVLSLRTIVPSVKITYFLLVLLGWDGEKPIKRIKKEDMGTQNKEEELEK